MATWQRLGKREMRYYIGDVRVTDVYFERNVKAMGRVHNEDGSKGPYVAVRMVDYKTVSPSLHKCGTKCMSAKGPSCECQCNGANHGINN